MLVTAAPQLRLDQMKDRFFRFVGEDTVVKESVMKKLLLIAAAVAGAGILTATVSAQAFPGHWRHHGSPALMVCLAAAPKTVKANLRSTFANSPLRSDRQAVWTAKQNLTEQVLAGNKSLTQYENALSQAQLKLVQDEDSLTQSACGQLTQAQLSAASTLYSNLQSNHQTVRGYFQAAHQAATE
jgi:hypothetical protein